AHDPCPTIPDVFVDPARMQALAQALKGATGVTAADLPPAAGAAPDAAAPAAVVYEAPEVQQRSVVATKGDAQAFGAIVADAAWRRGFYGAERRAFVGDGSGTNWGVWERHFSSFEPI